MSSYITSIESCIRKLGETRQGKICQYYESMTGAVYYMLTALDDESKSRLVQYGILTDLFESNQFLFDDFLFLGTKYYRLKPLEKLPQWVQILYLEGLLTRSRLEKMV